MERDELRRLLGKVRRGSVGVDEAIERLSLLSTADLGFARIDRHRAIRRGFPEVVYGPGKSPQQITEIARTLREAGQITLITRVGTDVHEAVRAIDPRAEYHEAARAVVLRPAGRRRWARAGILVCTAGTADISVGEEAALTAELMGNRVERLHDVGVAGLHRLTEHLPTLAKARVIVAVAGMEGALPSVLAGLTRAAVIGVPTSVGYGTGAGGRAALLAMLNSCAAGVTVVNVDNGFGAGFAAGLINDARSRGSGSRRQR